MMSIPEDDELEELAIQELTPSRQRIRAVVPLTYLQGHKARARSGEVSHPAVRGKPQRRAASDDNENLSEGESAKRNNQIDAKEAVNPPSLAMTRADPSRLSDREEVPCFARTESVAPTPNSAEMCAVHRHLLRGIGQQRAARRMLKPTCSGESKNSCMTAACTRRMTLSGPSASPRAQGDTLPLLRQRTTVD